MTEYIDRTALLEKLPDEPYKEVLRRVLMQAPVADVAKVVHGHWEEVTDTVQDILREKDLPLLCETNNVYDEMMRLPKRLRECNHYLPPSRDRAKLRSKTCSGIAWAMAEQWG